MNAARPMHLGVALGNLGLWMGHSVDPVAHANLSMDLAVRADRLGFWSVWVGDHLALPREPSTPYPYGPGAFLDADGSLLDPVAVLAAASRCTEHVRLGFGVLVVPYRHPLVSAKLIATIDALSNGRVILGVGVGWMPEESAAVGADFSARGRTTDETLAYWRHVFAHGEVDGMTVLPTPVQRPGPPVWVGGQSPAAMRRAVAFADVWDAEYVPVGELRDARDRLHARCVEVGRDPASIGLSVRGIPAADVHPGMLEAYGAVGVSHVGVVLPVREPDRAVEELDALAARCPDALRSAR